MYFPFFQKIYYKVDLGGFLRNQREVKNMVEEEEWEEEEEWAEEEEEW